MPSLFKFRLIAFLCLSLFLTACITLPGHRIIVDEESFYLHVEAPSKEIRREIIFNDEQTVLLQLPESVQIKLMVIEKGDKHQLKIKSKNGKITYDYKVDGKRVEFEPYGQQWFASQIPKIMSEMGIKHAS